MAQFESGVKYVPYSQEQKQCQKNPCHDPPAKYCAKQQDHNQSFHPHEKNIPEILVIGHAPESDS